MNAMWKTSKSLIWPLFPTSWPAWSHRPHFATAAASGSLRSFCAAAKAANANTKASVLIIFKTKYSACNHAFSLARGSCRCCSDRPRCSARGTTEADLARRKLRGLPQFGDIVLKCSFIFSTFRGRVDTALRLLQDLCGVCEKH